MSESSGAVYTPPEVWQWQGESGGQFASINRPVAGPTHEQALPTGRHPLQLYSLGTPNGVKITIMLEELLAKGHSGAEYDAHLIRITEGEQFSSGFVEINPNSKIPALVDQSDKAAPLAVFESGAILTYLAEKFAEFFPTEVGPRAQCNAWLHWLMGSAPYLGGGFGHFYAYAPQKWQYPIDRYTMEVKRQLDVLDRQLAKSKYVAGSEYTIADMAIWPWYGQLAQGKLYNADKFLDVASYQHVRRWADELNQRPAVRRGVVVNKTWGDENRQLPERHDASDFDGLDI